MQSNLPQSLISPAPSVARAIHARLLGGPGQRKLLLVFSIGCTLAALGTAALGLGGAEALHSVGKSPWMMDGRSTVSLVHPQGLMACALTAVMGAMVKWIGTTLAAFSGAKLAGAFGRSLRHDLLAEWFVRLGHADQRSRSSDALSMLTLRAAEAEQAIAQGLFRMVRGGLSFVPMVVLLVATTPRFAWIALGSVALFSWVLGRARRAFRARHARLQAQVDAYVGAADEATKHGDLWVTFGKTSWVLKSLDTLSDELTKRRARSDALGAWLSGTNEVLAALAILVGAVVLRLQGSGGEREIELLRASVLVFAAYGPLRDWTEGRLSYARGAAALGEWERVATSHTRAPSDAPARAWPEGELVLDGLGSHNASCALSLHAPFGSVVVLRGRTGSGKTSLLRVLLGLDAAARGFVHYAGKNISHAGTGPSERPFAWSPQDAPLLSGTMTDNVAMGSALKTEDGVLSDILDNVPHGGQPLGPGGIALSGGERAWVSLARAVSSRLPVLLLDEPTAGLDRESQSRFLELVSVLKGSRTVVIVTHRDEVIEAADQVVDLDALTASHDDHT